MCLFPASTDTQQTYILWLVHCNVACRIALPAHMSLPHMLDPMPIMALKTSAETPRY